MTLQAGERFDRYVIEDLLGRGGMGVVYRAYDEKLQRPVALKVLRVEAWEGTADRGAARLLREARAAAGLTHVNTIAIHDVGEVGDTAFISMELVEGRSLRAYVGDASVPVEQKTRYLVEVARALQAAHERGMVHRDVKPENVMVRRDGVVKVLDFGIARSFGAPPDDPAPSHGSKSGLVERLIETWTHESGLIGTPRYMAPEQLRGESLDARTDQFSWGVMAYELLTGSSPWPQGAAVSLTLVSAILDEAGPPEQPLLHACAPAVASVVLRTLRKAPRARFASMAEVLAALPPAESSLAPQAVTEAPGQPRPAAKVHAPLRRTLGVALGGVSLAAVAVVLGLFSARYASLHPPAGVDPTTSRGAPSARAAFDFRATRLRRVTLDDGCEEFPAFTPDGAGLVYAAEGGGAEHIVMRTLADETERALSRGADWDLAPAVSPDGRLVAFLRSGAKDLATYVVDIAGRVAPRRIAGGGTRPSFSPDGTALWCGQKGHPARYDLITGEPTRTLDSPPNAEGPLVRELRDGRVLAVYPGADWSSLAGVAVFSPSGAWTWLAQVESEEEVLAVSPDGRFVIGSRETSISRELFALPLEGGALIPLPSSDVHATKGLAFAPDGHRIAWSACAAVWSLGHMDSRAAFVELSRPDWDESAAVAIPGTRKLATLSSRSGVPALWIVDRSGREPPRHVWSGDEEHPPRDLDVSPDGELAVVETSKAGLMVVRLDDGGVSPLTTEAGDSAPHFQRDGRQVIFTRTLEGKAQQVSVVDVRGGQVQALLDRNTLEGVPSPVDQRLVYLAGGTDTNRRLPMLVDLAVRRARPLSPTLGEGRYAYTAFSPDGRRVALVSGDTRFLEVDVASGRVLRDFEADGMIRAPHYAGDEVWLARSSSRGNVWMADFDAADPDR